MEYVKRMIGVLKKNELIGELYHKLHWRIYSVWVLPWILRRRDERFRNSTIQQLEGFLSKQYSEQMKSELNMANPQRFTEKIQWLKIYDAIKGKTLLADKYLAREWVTHKTGGVFVRYP